MTPKIQRRMALQISSGYRTVSVEAAFVIAGIPSASLLRLERGRIVMQVSVPKAQVRGNMLVCF